MNSHLPLDVLLEQALLDGVHLYPVPVVIEIHHVGPVLRMPGGTISVGFTITVGVVETSWGVGGGGGADLRRLAFFFFVH